MGGPTHLAVRHNSGMEDLASRMAPLEYWFWKAAIPGGAAIVDYIVRRDRGEAELRVSTWLDDVRPVVHHRTESWKVDGTGIAIGEARLDVRGATGTVGDISWDLDWDLGEARVAPRPSWFGPVHPFDMELVCRPAAELSGTLTVAGQAVGFNGPASVAHYWGRRLPRRWTWISATGFDDDPDGRLEALLVSTRLWGRSPAIPAGYVWIRAGDSVETAVMPLTAGISEHGDGHGARLASLRLDGRHHTIECKAAAETFNDAGESIRQTMRADLVMDGRRRAAGSVGLEFRS